MAVTSGKNLRLERERMVRELLERRGIGDRRVLDAMRHVERHRFLDESLEGRAYGPYTLPIGCGQSMPHPLTVATMAAGLKLQGRETVLEIGTGSGYQTAVLAFLAGEVWSTERLPELARGARERLRAMQCDNVEVFEQSSLCIPGAPQFHAVHVNAAVPEVPGQLLALLRHRGRMVVPVGRLPHQRLLLLTRRGRDVTTRSLGACRIPALMGPSTEPLDRAAEHGL